MEDEENENDEDEEEDEEDARKMTRIGRMKLGRIKGK